MIQQQQGDVWIEQIATLPSNLRSKLDDKKLILAEGETHGHKHQLILENEDDVMVFEDQRNIFLEVKNDCSLIHEEHAAQILTKGFYKVGNVCEYDYTTQETRKAID